MFRKLLFALAASLALLLQPPAVGAQETAPPEEDANCIACHQELYYLYDTGNYHCLCEASPSCIHCHGGQPDTVEADLAHAGVILNPLQEDAAVCRTCHCDDCQERVEQFIASAGGTVTSGRGRSFPTPGPEPTRPPPGGQAYHLPEQLREPGRQAALAVMAMVLMGVAVLGIWCYRTDRCRLARS